MVVVRKSVSNCTLRYEINELRQCYFDSGASLTGFVQPVSLISVASVVQETNMHSVKSYEY